MLLTYPLLFLQVHTGLSFSMIFQSKILHDCVREVQKEQILFNLFIVKNDVICTMRVKIMPFGLIFVSSASNNEMFY